MTSRSRKLSGLRFVLVGEQSLLIHCATRLLERGAELVCVFSEDESISSWCESSSVPFQPTSVIDDIAPRLDFDYLLSITNFSLLSDTVLDSAKHRCVNFHDGPLPGYAGLNTPAWALINGEVEHGITWHLIDSGIDTGRIVMTYPVAIDEDDTAFSLNTKCYEAAISTFAEMIDRVTDDGFSPSDQPSGSREYFSRKKRPAFGGALDFTVPANELSRLVRGLDFGAYENPLGLPKVYTESRVFFVKGMEVGESSSPQAPGTIISNDGRLGVATATNDVYLELTATSGDDELLLPTIFPVGVRLPTASDIGLPGYEKLFKQAAAQEASYLRLLERSKPLVLPYRRAVQPQSTDRSEAKQTIPRGVSEAEVFAVVTMYFARLSGQSEFDVGLVNDYPLPFYPESVVRLVVDEAETVGTLSKTISGLFEQSAAKTVSTADIFDRYPQISNPFPSTVSWDRSQNPSDSSAELVLKIGSEGKLVWDYRLDIFAANEIERMQRDVERLFQYPETNTLEDFDLVPESELSGLLSQWEGPTVEFEASTRIETKIDQIAAEHPELIAVRDSDSSLTYSALAAASDAIAAGICNTIPESELLVGVHMRRSCEMIATLLGILKSGRAYVPLDPAFPRERLELMVRDSELQLIVCSDGATDRISNIPTRAYSDLAAPDGIKSNANSPLAYVIYTSGSTGKPKGVCVTHSNVMNFFAAMDEAISVKVGKRWFAVTSLSFDISVLELLWTLTRGLEIILFDGREIRIDETRRTAQDSRDQGVLDFSLFFFSSYEPDKRGSEQYQLLLDSAKYADTHGYGAVWTPERHFHEFGGLFPNPAVTSAALSTITKNVRLRAGSSVSPLHHILRLAEEWSVVDNLSDGRIDISFAAGWQKNDFVLQPQNFENRKQVMFDQIEQIKKLWRGDKLVFQDPTGEHVELSIRPKPVQTELNIWITAAGNPETFRLAGEKGYNILTHLLGQSPEELEEKIQIYRDARSDAGMNPEAGRVTLMLHTFVGDDRKSVREIVREPMKEYLRSSLGLIKQAAWQFPTFKQQTTDPSGKFSMDHLSEEDANVILDHSFERYFETSGLFGTVEECVEFGDNMRSCGVDEIACLIDFGVPSDDVLASLPLLTAVKNSFSAAESPPASAATVIRETDSAYMQCTPSMARMMLADNDGRQALRSLQKLLVGGEALPSDLAADLLHECDQVFNMYGPTETTIWSSYQQVSTDAASPISPIGRPIANTQFYVVDNKNRPLPEGVPGVLHIGGDGVTEGYLGNRELTKERFFSLDFAPSRRVYNTGDVCRARADGSFEYIGREDFQVKVRGYRIELGDVESALASHASVEQAIATTDDSGSLIAFLKPTEGRKIETSAIDAHIRTLVPEYMIPSRYSSVTSFPLTPNKKVDRGALVKGLKGATTRTASTVDIQTNGKKQLPSSPAATELESTIETIWKEVLQVESCGLDENFFDLGGHSLLAVQVNARLQDELGTNVSLIDLFRFPTIRTLASHLSEAEGDLGDVSVSTGTSRAEKRKRARRRKAT